MSTETNDSSLTAGATVGLALGLALGVGALLERHDYFLALPTYWPADAVSATLNGLASWGWPISRTEAVLLVHAGVGLVGGGLVGWVLGPFCRRLKLKRGGLVPLALLGVLAVWAVAIVIWSRRGLAATWVPGWVLGAALLVWTLGFALGVNRLLHRGWSRGVILVACGLLLLVGGWVWRSQVPSFSSASVQLNRPAHPVLLIGLDAASWANLDLSIEAGAMPVLEALKTRSAWGELESQDPTWSPVIWTTIATGRGPSKHGILDFSKDGVPYSSNSRTAWAFWDLLPTYGAQSSFHYWWASWPAEEVDGRIVTDRFQQQGLDQRVYPPEEQGRIDEILRRASQKAPSVEDVLGGVPSDGFGERHAIKLGVLEEFLLRDEFVTEMSVDAIEDGRFDLVSVYLRGIDAIGHKFWEWHYQETAPFFAQWVYGETDQDQRILGPVVRNVDSLIDGWVSRVLEAAGPDWNVVIVSDHGMRATVPRSDGAEPETGTHHRSGLILMAGPDVKEDFVIRGASIYDVFPTIMYLMGLPVARDLPGRILFEALNAPEGELPMVAWLDRYEDRPLGDPTPIRTDKDEGYLERLKALGYVVD
ncbi:MAG: alkaline phosphatase family protein [Myxococcota bacterium]|nr:alkaline phosphatase family protein [Myxococcota bacterium]